MVYDGEKFRDMYCLLAITTDYSFKSGMFMSYTTNNSVQFSVLGCQGNKRHFYTGLSYEHQYIEI